MRRQQLFQEDIRDLTNIHELKSMELLGRLIAEQSGQLCSYTKLANKVNVTVDTIRRWMVVLSNLYFCFEVRPWSKNIARSIIKEPKYYLWNWSNIKDVGQKNENIIASHLLKAAHYWTDMGLGEYELHYLRDKNKREVDFIVTKNGEPFFLVEVKTSEKSTISESLRYFTDQLKIERSYQVVFNLEFVDANCFSKRGPIIVPAKTFLSQLV